MPCNSDYMDASGREIAMSQVCCLLDEIRTGKPVDTRSGEWRGYHPRVYNKRGETDDALVAALCDYLRAHGSAKHSLEMQAWWRDHQRADAERIKREQDAAEAERVRQEALAKLSPSERKALGLK